MPQTADPFPYEAVMEGVQALRYDPRVERLQRLPPGDKARVNAVAAALKPIADAYGITVKALALKMAQMMESPTA